MVSVDEVDDELHTEIAEECGKLGPVEHVEIYIDPASQEVRIFVLFANPQGSRCCAFVCILSH